MLAVSDFVFNPKFCDQMDEDIFADLTGLAKPKPPPAASPTADASPPIKTPGTGPVLPDGMGMASPSDVFSSANGAGSKHEGVLITLSKAELESVVREAVDGALDATMAKFVKSIKTVLEDMSRRIEATGGSFNELRSLNRAARVQSCSMHA